MACQLGFVEAGWQAWRQVDASVSGYRSSRWQGQSISCIDEAKQQLCQRLIASKLGLMLLFALPACLVFGVVAHC